MFPFFVEAYPWDLATTSGEKRLERLHGEVGITGVALWASAPPFSVLHRFGAKAGVVRSPGGLLYRPQKNAFASSRCQPAIASTPEVVDSMRRALDVCDQYGLSVRFIASVLRSGDTALLHSEYAAINAFGTRSQDCLCASNVEVQRYARNLAASLLALEGGAQLVVSDMVSGCDDVLRVPRSYDSASLSTAEQALLTWCFCNACVERAGRAGVEVGAVKDLVKTIVADAIDRGPQDELAHDSFPAMDTVMEAYWTSHLDTVAELFEAVRTAGGRDVVFAEENMCDVAASPATPLQVFAGALDEFQRISDDNDAPVEIVFPAALAVAGEGAELTASLKAAIDAEVQGVTVRHLAVIPETAIQPLKQALRFARRAVRS